MRDKLAAIRGGFLRRVGQDADILMDCWSAKKLNSPTVLTRIKDIAHGLAGAGGIFGFPQISSAAATLEEAVTIRLNGAGRLREVERSLERLLTGLAAIRLHQIERARRRADA
jgi:HPt (histidine-containing phosphotransfer) domain-containing protein